MIFHIYSFVSATVPIYFVLATCPHMFGNVSPYIWQYVPVYLAMCPHIFGNMSQYIWQCVPIYLAICPHIHIFCPLDIFYCESFFRTHH
jgi:hypothetical protein